MNTETKRTLFKNTTVMETLTASVQTSSAKLAEALKAFRKHQISG